MVGDGVKVLDDAVALAIASGHRSLSEISQHTRLKERVVDRTLQRLRRAGRVRFERYGVASGQWYVVQPERS